MFDYWRLNSIAMVGQWLRSPAGLLKPRPGRVGPKAREGVTGRDSSLEPWEWSTNWGRAMVFQTMVSLLSLRNPVSSRLCTCTVLFSGDNGDNTTYHILIFMWLFFFFDKHMLFSTFLPGIPAAFGLWNSSSPRFQRRSCGTTCALSQDAGKTVASGND